MPADVIGTPNIQAQFKKCNVAVHSAYLFLALMIASTSAT